MISVISIFAVDIDFLRSFIWLWFTKEKNYFPVRNRPLSNWPQLNSQHLFHDFNPTFHDDKVGGIPTISITYKAAKYISRLAERKSFTISKPPLTDTMWSGDDFLESNFDASWGFRPRSYQANSTWPHTPLAFALPSCAPISRLHCHPTQQSCSLAYCHSVIVPVVATRCSTTSNCYHF